MVTSGGTIVRHIQPGIVVEAKPAILILCTESDDIVELPFSEDDKINRVSSMDSPSRCTFKRSSKSMSYLMVWEVVLNR